jgi:hypothetical protein
MSNNKRQRGGWGVVRYLPVLGSPKNEDHFMDRNHPSFSDPKHPLFAEPPIQIQYRDQTPSPPVS